MARKFIGKAIKHPGSLDREVGGPAHEHMRRVRYLAKHGTPEQKRRANLFLKVLLPAERKRRAHA